MYTNKFPKTCIRRMAKAAGAERISADAMKEINDVIASYCHDLAERSNTYAKHAGRKTITKADVKLALK